MRHPPHTAPLIAAPAGCVHFGLVDACGTRRSSPNPHTATASALPSAWPQAAQHVITPTPVRHLAHGRRAV